MTNADSAYPTVLLIRVEVPTEDGTRDRQRQRPESELAFVRAALLQSGQCGQTLPTDNGLIACFAAVDDAFEAACAVQQAWAGRGNTPARLRMLLDRAAEAPLDAAATGPTGPHNLVADKLLEQTSPERLFATRAIVGRLSELALARFQVFGHERPDQSEGGELYEVACNEATITRIALSTLHQEGACGPRHLCLRWRDHTVTLEPDSPALSMGRGEHSDIRIESDLASRTHAHLSFHETNFVLADQSTNGTFVQIDEDDEVFLHNEQIVLRGSGVISLGRRIQGGRGKLVYFTLTTRPEQRAEG